MAQEQDLTFITEDIPAATSFIQSGKSLRLSYIGRAEAKTITDMLLEKEDPNTIDEKTWTSLRSAWKKEAEILYPDEGDYKVWLIDPNTQEPVAIGEMVEFIGGEIREHPGILPCFEYVLDLSEEEIPDPKSFIIDISYTDCTIRQVNISDTASNLLGLSICVGQDRTPITSSGIFTKIEECNSKLI